MKLNLRSPQFLTGVALVALALVAVSIRVFLPYDAIFSGQGIKFSSIDAYYQMRLIDNLVHNFPHLNHFDPYLIFPTGAHINDIPFFNWIQRSPSSTVKKTPNSVPAKSRPGRM